MSTSSLSLRPASSSRLRAVLVLLVALLAHAVVLDRAQQRLTGTDAARSAQQPTVNARLLPPPPAPVVVSEAPAALPRPRPRRPVPPPPKPAPVAPADLLPRVEAPVPAEATPAIVDMPDVVRAEGPVADAVAPEAPEAGAEPAEAAVKEESAPFEATGAALQSALAVLPDLRGALPAKARYVFRTKNSEIRLATGTTYVDWTLADDGRYELRLSTTAVGMTVLELHSQGALREFGLAPDRYTETRARRGAEAADFDWQGGRVTFSRRPHERPLAQGVQDRISFQFQLMLIGQAQPERFRAGAEIVLWMAGRDDLLAYRFRSAGLAATATGVGSLEAVHLERITASESEARIEVWLVPQLGWLPVRLRFTDRLGRVTESVLESLPAS